MDPELNPVATRAWGGEQSRARYPEREGDVVRGDVRVHWESYGSGTPAVLLLPTWSIMHSRCWKMQIPFLARRHRVVTFDPRGNGRSDRPTDRAAYAEEEFAADAMAVMDATETDDAVVVGFSLGAQRAILLAAEGPTRVRALVLVAPLLELGGAEGEERQAAREFEVDTGSDEGWGRYNAHSWRRDYPGFVGFFFPQVFTEPHSTKQIEDSAGWGLETDPETLVAAEVPGLEATRARELLARLGCPVLVVQGEQDAVVPPAIGAEAAARTGGRLVTLRGSGHCPQIRDPVQFNGLLDEFITAPGPRRRWTRAQARPKRALYVSSPIGLGHVRRDLAIADELRRLHPDLEIHWLAQHPVTTVLEARGEQIHPMSGHLASESHHIQREANGHELHCFQALRRMDEILIANFMVFHDLVAEEPFDLWIGDEAWDLDYYLHENPELKSAPFVWLTDFVGYLPMATGGEHEAFLTADYNAEMIEHIARYPSVRDRAIFIGEPDDIVPDSFGPGLPRIRDWTVEHFSFSGYVTGFDEEVVHDRDGLRRRLGYREGEPVCVVSVGGSGVGLDLLQRVIDAYPQARERVESLRMIVVSGPRIDPTSLSAPPGVEVHAYVDGLYEHLAACDLAVVQGGLTTCMELTASGTPFLYFPLKDHFEQQRHVAHRLDRYRAGHRLDYETSSVTDIAEAIAANIGQRIDYLPVARDGAARAAEMIAELL